LQSTWGKVSFGLGALVLWATRLRRVNGPNFTWPLVQFSSVVSDGWLERRGLVYQSRPLPRRTRDELLTTVRPQWRNAIAAARTASAQTQPLERPLAVL
jgi:hypothetical protein